MMSARIHIVVGLLGLIAFSALADTTYATEGPSGVTGATAHATWKVLGKVDGIRGTVVRYNEKLHRGGQIVSMEGAKELQRLGIKTVIAITPTEDERRLASQHGFQLVEVPFEKDVAIPKEMLEFFVKTVNENEGPFYIHCGTGLPRGGALAAAYRVNVEKWTCEQAILEFKNLGGDDKAAKPLLDSIEK